jgi:hypothetical protein
MTPNDQADRRAAPRFGKLKARQLVRVKREEAKNSRVISGRDS